MVMKQYKLLDSNGNEFVGVVKFDNSSNKWIIAGGCS